MQRPARRLVLALPVALAAATALADERLEGRVEAAGAPIAEAEVALWSAGPGAPQRLATATTAEDGSYALTVPDGRDEAGVLYLVATGGAAEGSAEGTTNAAAAMMSTLGAEPPARATINELTTVASAWTAAQFLDGAAMSGAAIGLRIAAGNVPNLVDLETGGLGPVIADPLNAPRTTALAKMNTLGLLLSACVTAIPDACGRLFDAATPPAGPRRRTRWRRRRTSPAIPGTTPTSSSGCWTRSIRSRQGGDTATCR